MLLALLNNSTWCYANSSLLCCLWTIMSRISFHVGDLGSMSDSLLAMLTSLTDEPIALVSYPWFQELVNNWTRASDQEDSAEFTDRLLTKMESIAISNSWERRLYVGQNVEIHDGSDTAMPIVLQFDMDMIADNETTLTALLRNWHGLHGMCAGLTSPSDILVVQVDRFVSNNGTVDKLHTAVHFSWQAQVPVFRRGLIQWETFQVVAASSHSGHAHGGHYQTLLKTFPRTDNLEQPSMWLFCDDNRVPHPCLVFPDGFEEGVTSIWLVRNDQVELHQLCTPTPTAAPEDLIALLENQPTCAAEGSLPP